MMDRCESVKEDFKKSTQLYKTLYQSMKITFRHMLISCGIWLFESTKTIRKIIIFFRRKVIGFFTEIIFFLFE